MRNHFDHPGWLGGACSTEHWSSREWRSGGIRRRTGWPRCATSARSFRFDRRLVRPGRRHCPRPADRQVQQGRLEQHDPRAQPDPGVAGHLHSGLRLVRVQSGLDVRCLRQRRPADRDHRGRDPAGLWLRGGLGDGLHVVDRRKAEPGDDGQRHAGRPGRDHRTVGLRRPDRGGRDRRDRGCPGVPLGRVLRSDPCRRSGRRDLGPRRERSVGCAGDRHLRRRDGQLRRFPGDWIAVRQRRPVRCPGRGSRGGLRVGVRGVLHLLQDPRSVREDAGQPGGRAGWPGHPRDGDGRVHPGRAPIHWPDPSGPRLGAAGMAASRRHVPSLLGGEPGLDGLDRPGPTVSVGRPAAPPRTGSRRTHSAPGRSAHPCHP
jgi:hypothetical protein